MRKAGPDPMSVKTRPDMSGVSVLAMSGMVRLAVALGLSSVLWIAVYWALAS